MHRWVLKTFVFYWLSFSSLWAAGESMDHLLTQQATQLLQNLSLQEKIGQKLMLDFRYWCETKPEDTHCQNDFVEMNNTVKQVITDYHIGGIILFSNNLKNIAQITTLNDAFQQTMLNMHKLPLFISTDQEGGIVARLPRDVSVTFAGNMATAAAYLGEAKKTEIVGMGKVLATHLKAVGININLAPAVDVNINPLNPVIHVRSFSDDPSIVAELGKELSHAMQMQGVGTALKHFPGHGDTSVDSHIGLPVVNHTLEQAEQIDLAPFKAIIATTSPDLIMMAHIQFPVLDNSKIYASRIDQEIITPATFSLRIQRDLLRNQLGFRGVIVTDALNMGAIAENFDPFDATLKAFQAGSDIVLMPIQLTSKEDVSRLQLFISKLEAAVLEGSLSIQALDESVLRILKLKIKLGLMHPDPTPLPQKIARAQTIIADKAARNLEAKLTDQSITLVKNDHHLIPVNDAETTKIHILTPWLEQGAGIAKEVERLQSIGQVSKKVHVHFVKMSETDLAKEKQIIDQSDLIIVGNITNKSMPLPVELNQLSQAAVSPLERSLVFPEIPAADTATKAHRAIADIMMSSGLTFESSQIGGTNDALFAYQVLQYAKQKGKKTIFLSLLAPYDLPNYATVSDAMLAGYDFYGYVSDDHKGHFRGPSMPALARIIFGIAPARGKLPVNVPNPNHPEQIIYHRGHGIN